MILFVKNLKCISRLNIHYYPNRRYKSDITSLKAVIVGKCLSSAGLDILIEFCILYFMIKYSKFTLNIGSGNFTDTFCQNTNKFKKSVCVCVCVGGGGGGGGVNPPAHIPSA